MWTEWDEGEAETERESWGWVGYPVDRRRMKEKKQE